MNTILELREKRTKAWEAAKAFLDTKRGADGIVSAEDTPQHMTRWKPMWSLSARKSTAWKSSRLWTWSLVVPPQSLRPASPSTAHRIKPRPAVFEYKQSMIDALRSNFRRVSNILQEGVDADGGYPSRGVRHVSD